MILSLHTSRTSSFFSPFQLISQCLAVSVPPVISDNIFLFRTFSGAKSIVDRRLMLSCKKKLRNRRHKITIKTMTINLKPLIHTKQYLNSQNYLEFLGALFGPAQDLNDKVLIFTQLKCSHQFLATSFVQAHFNCMLDSQ